MEECHDDDGTEHGRGRSDVVNGTMLVDECTECCHSHRTSEWRRTVRENLRKTECSRNFNTFRGCEETFRGCTEIRKTLEDDGLRIGEEHERIQSIERHEGPFSNVRFLDISVQCKKKARCTLFFFH